ncbi:MAG TPA: ADP-ribosylglycohydrolase family protein [Planctomycetota bacterium]|jgi:hypothetical protein|nr:ADP-ribosylglycohydrolase family protein [Planctomycetota bacterium]OQC19877.1 MAG: ADP-ribosylglycohydrolase [Planctomycetes bacterium ADurb.Bin069]HNR99491.1 ADP-ribosylglycohydrolase family protein [Planctomycetota bacterium]HNU26320.1 ADP-ribosylglycohydrolase family protein [Planctomycetota bacterium]HOE30546.1 ADP-ribosylglycohydrolase family protein [Planctomycetota bacterium]
MQRRIIVRAAAFLAAAATAASAAGAFRTLSVAEYRDKMKAGWIGQMAGVGWGGPTEFKWMGKIIPAEAMPPWKPETINQFHQDDIYVEMTFVRTLELYGLDVSIRQAGIDFANSGYPLWHANHAGRHNLRNGIAPPDSGHPRFNSHADDIDYQIEADFSGLIAPGLPNIAIALGEKFGRLMNYGDGLYGGQFVGGMYTEAFFEEDPLKIVQAGLACVPAGSMFAETIRDVIAWWQAHPDDWEKTWELVERKYQRNKAYRRFSCTGPEADFNIDAKLNAAYIVIGLLYGKRDPDATIIISCRCGQDSDCNPSNAGGVLFTSMGFARLPERFYSALDENGVFSHTAYNVPKLLAACEKLAREAVVKAGGKIVVENGEERFLIPVAAPVPSALEQCWEPGPIAGSRFTPEEMERITAVTDIVRAVKQFAPGWKITNCGPDMDPGLRPELRGKKNVLLTHPQSRTVPCALSREASIPAGVKTRLVLEVGHHEEGDWELVVKADGVTLFQGTIGKDTAKNGWRTVAVDLSAYAGKTVRLELLNQANGWAWEAGYWASIALVSE